MTNHSSVRNIGGLVALQAELGDKPFIWIDEKHLTFREAHLQSNRVAEGLRTVGIRQGDVVATFLYNSLECVDIWFAAAKIGAIRAGVNVALRRRDLAYTLRDCRARMIVLETELLEPYLAVRGLFPRLTEYLVGDEAVAAELNMRPFRELYTDTEKDVVTDVQPWDLCGITYTGGSTGMPKGVAVSHEYHIAFGPRFAQVGEVQPSDVMYDSGHMFHLGQLGVIGPLYCGITSVLSKWFSVGALWPLVDRHRVTIMHFPGSMIRPILDRTPDGDGPRSHVRLAFGMGTGQVQRHLVDTFERRFGFPLLGVYAQSEVGALMCSERLGRRRTGSSGADNEWAEVRIVDEEDRPVDARIVGEIVLRPRGGSQFMSGYWNKPAATVAAWRNLWHHTGDLGYLDEEGFLYFAGRKAYWIRRRGENVSCVEVEQVLGAFPGVRECAVVGVASELGDEEVKAWIVCESGRDLDVGSLVAWCESQLAYFKVPRYIEFSESLPRTAAKGEIERYKLRALGVGGAWDRLGAEAKPERPTRG